MAGVQFGWLVSYPKSGNTWMRMMLASLLSDGGPIDINQLDIRIGIATFAEMDEFLGIESCELTREEIAAARPALHGAIAAEHDEPLILRKVHDRYWRTPSGDPAFVPDMSRGAIYLVRDPRDVVISYSHHRGSEIDRVIGQMADDDIALAGATLRGKEQLPQPLGAWNAHVLSWVDQAEIPTLVIRYEDMLSAPTACLAKVCAHLGIDASESGLHAATVATSFDTLSTQENASGFRERLTSATAPFFRQGRAGGWREQLSTAQAERIGRDHREVMTRFGYL
jgi:aryl sulfotransferase